MSALTSLLIRDRIVPLEKIEEAIQKQVISGGELDTALLELGLVDENVMAAYCAATHGVLPATRDEIMTVGRDTIRVVPKEVAEKRRVVPLRSQEGSLVVAVSRPLPADVEQQLAFLLGAELVQRVVTELRISAALHHHYGLEMSPRHRRLVEKLRKRDPGLVPYVEPTAGARLDPARLAGATEAEEVLEAKAESPALEPEEVAPMGAAASDTGPGRGDFGSKGPVTARFGIPRGSVGKRAPTGQGSPRRGTRPGRKLRRGPLTTGAAAKQLEEAKNRDEILETLLAFAEQFFDCTVLFTVRTQQARGRLMSGADLSPEELREVRLPLDMPGTFHDAFAVCAPRLSRFDGQEADALALNRLGREDCTPAVVLPVTIRERVVILLYGDRGGDDFNLSDIPEVLALLPQVTRAFGAVLMARKLGGFTAAKPTKEPELKVAPASLPPPPAKFSAAAEASPAEPAASPPPKPPRPAAFDLLGVPRSAPPPPMPVPHSADTGGAADRSADESSHESAEEQEEEPEGPTTEAEAATDDEPDLELGDDDEDWDDEDWDDLDEVAIDVEPASSSGPRPRTPSASPASSMYMLSGTTTDHVDQPARARQDARVASGGAPPRQEVVQVGDVSAVTPADAPHAQRRHSAPPPGQAKVIVDMGAPVEDAVQQLIGCGPGDEGPAIDRILRVGDAALPVLVREFPGPLWFDRHEPHRKLPRGRDVSAIGQALVALGERSIPYLPTLIDARDTERRFYATLLSSEFVHPDIIPSLGRRLFDEDAGVRALATDVLRLHSIFPKAMRTLLEGVRAMAKVPRADEGRRVRAVDALGTLRDARSLDTLVELLGSDSRPLRTAARWALVTLTRQDFGKSQNQWKGWAKNHGQKHRVEWLIDALMHEEEATREAASLELKQLTQQYHGYQAKQSRHDRSVAQRHYLKWWASEGRKLFNGDSTD